jgi:hypothetical protein
MALSKSSYSLRSSLSYPHELFPSYRSSIIGQRQQQGDSDGLRRRTTVVFVPHRDGWVPVSPTEGRHLSPVCPSCGSVSPQRPSPVATGFISPGASEARSAANSPSSSRHARSHGAPPRAWSRSPPRSHKGYLMRYPPPVRGNGGP